MQQLTARFYADPRQTGVLGGAAGVALDDALGRSRGAGAVDQVGGPFGVDGRGLEGAGRVGGPKVQAVGGPSHLAAELDQGRPGGCRQFGGGARLLRVGGVVEEERHLCIFNHAGERIGQHQAGQGHERDAAELDGRDQHREIQPIEGDHADSPGSAGHQPERLNPPGAGARARAASSP